VKLRKTIMMIEDDPGLRSGLFQVLRVTGCDLLSASTGSEAMERVPRDKPDLILLDLVSESVGGYDFLRELRRHAGGQRIPVVAMIAQDEELGKQASKAGASDLLEPEPEPHALLEKVCKHLGFDLQALLDELQRLARWKDIREEGPYPRARTRLERSRPLALPDRGKKSRLAITDDAGKKRAS
jgi:CheY-like chemotaxis protein